MLKEVKRRHKEILVELSEGLDVNILEGAITSEHILLYLPVPPEYAAAQYDEGA